MEKHTKWNDGHDTQVFQYFTPQVSDKNLGLLGVLPKNQVLDHDTFPFQHAHDPYPLRLFFHLDEAEGLRGQAQGRAQVALQRPDEVLLSTRNLATQKTKRFQIERW